MGFIFNLLACLVSIIIGFYTYVKWKFQYWKREGVPFIEPTFPFGSSGNPFGNTKPYTEELEGDYKYFKSQGYKYGGLYYTFGNAVYLPVHPETVKAVMSKDFNHFVDRGGYYNEKDDPLSASIFNLEGQRWKKLRAKLTPTFTSGKMKMMFHILISCGNQLVTAVDKLPEKAVEIDIKEILGCYTTDVIGSCAFGIECNSFDENESEFRKYGRKFFTTFSTFQMFKTIVAFTTPSVARFFGISIMEKETTDFFFNAVKETVKYRESTNFKRNDFMQLLINLKNGVEDFESHDSKGTETHKLTIQEIAAQAFVFFIAGFETSSATMSFCLLELALNQEIQDKVREEVLDILENNGGEFTYDSMMEYNYLSQVVDETLRKYPPVPAITRVCVEDYKIPGTNSTVKKGATALIPAYALQRDPEYFPDPDNFDPERFNVINKPKIPAFTYLPFGEGPRICIGSRFGLMQTKVGLSVLLKQYRFTVNEKTKLPLTFERYSFVLAAQGGIWLNIEKIN